MSQETKNIQTQVTDDLPLCLMIGYRIIQANWCKTDTNDDVIAITLENDYGVRIDVTVDGGFYMNLPHSYAKEQA